jgi:PadR family transcriptional regulator AphA
VSVDERQLTAFEHILLGLICMAPSSGYDLKRILAVTPMGVYQPSSGALYPALRRLAGKGLVRAQDQAGADGDSARRRRVYEPTGAGRTVHLSWLRAPVERATASRDLGLHLMRFVMMEHLFTAGEVRAFLVSLADALEALTGQLERYAAAASGSDGLHARLALGHGLAVHRASLGWAQETLDALSAAPVG